MKAESNLQPKRKFEIENVIGGKCEIIFFENISEMEQTEEGEKRYSFDTYRLEANYREELQEELNNDEEKYQAWLELARKAEYAKLAQEIRTRRDELLNETDWTQMKDTSLSEEKQEAYRKYRQELRDVPEQEGFPYEVKFPTLV